MIIDDSFALFERADDNIIRSFKRQKLWVNDSFSVHSFANKRARTEMANGKMTEVAVKISQNDS